MPQTAAVNVTAEPVDSYRCKFIVSHPVAGAGVRKYTSPEEAGDSHVAEAVLQVPAVCEVVVSGNVVTVVQDGSQPWSALEPQVAYAIQTAVRADTADAPVVAGSPDDDTMFDLVSHMFGTQINPAVAQHGGKVELVDVQDGVVVVRMFGGCQGCGMANVTLRQGIEGLLRRAVQGFAGIKDITDHAAGANPYFAPGTK